MELSKLALLGIVPAITILVIGWIVSDDGWPKVTRIGRFLGLCLEDFYRPNPIFRPTLRGLWEASK